MRMVIYVIYEKSGRLSRDLEYMLKELRGVTDYLVIVINGEIDAQEMLDNLADYLIIRENKGFDAGAYKTALSQTKIKEQVDKSDELVFCNDTFYGVFISFLEKIY